MIVEIEGTRLPGRACLGYENIHVGLGLHRQPFDLVAGDTRGKGNPLCARVKPPAITWR